MHSHKFLKLAVILFGILMGPHTFFAQQIPPAEPPKQMPVPEGEPQTLEVTANEVLVPTLVEKPHGGIIYGLKTEDFIVEDDGVPQKIRLQEEMDTAPVALVVAVEQGAMSVLEFDKFSRLARFSICF